jgi:hypothetical protein
MVALVTASNAQWDDSYEENDTCDWPTPLPVATWLNSINGYGIALDDDWFSINVPAGELHVIIDCQFSDSRGDIDLYLHHPGQCTGEALAKSESTDNNELIEYTVASPGLYVVLVKPVAPHGNLYNLHWDSTALQQDDAYEENDTHDEAHPLVEGSWLSDLSGLGAMFDTDWYEIEITPGNEHITVDCQFSHAQENINIDLHRLGSLGPEWLTGSWSATDNEFIDLTVSAPGTHLIEVRGQTQSGATYNLRWDGLASDRSAEIVDHSIPTAMIMGESVDVWVDVQNTGAMTWHADGADRFALADPEDDSPFDSDSRMLMPPGTTVATGETVRFTETLAAPSAPGTYLCNWQMRQEPGTSFGEMVSVEIDVAALSAQEVVDHLLGHQPDPTGLDVNHDGDVDAADVVTVIDALTGSP